MAMLAIPLSLDISRLFREVDVDAFRDPSDHITLFTFGDDLEINKILKIIPVVFNITSGMQPFEVSSTRITTFPKGDKGYPVISEIKSKELEEIHTRIEKAFKSKGIKFDTTFSEYKPHVTLGYAKKRPKTIKFDKVKWSISQIALYGGDNADSKLFVNFPFTLGTTKSAQVNTFAQRFYEAI